MLVLSSLILLAKRFSRHVSGSGNFMHIDPVNNRFLSFTGDIQSVALSLMSCAKWKVS
jgi:hypothetical protein